MKLCTTDPGLGVHEKHHVQGKDCDCKVRLYL